MFIVAPIITGVLSDPLSWGLLLAFTCAIALLFVDSLYFKWRLRHSKLPHPQPPVTMTAEIAQALSASEGTSTELTRGEQFLLTDFEYMRAFKEQSVNIADKRIDIYVALATAVGGGLAFLAHDGYEARRMLIIVAVSCAALLTVGISTYLLVLDRDILIVDYIRASNRIRAYFAEHDAAIRDYLLMPVNEAYPRYGWQASSRPIPMIINALCFGLFALSVSMLERNLTSIDAQAMSFCALYFAVAWTLQWTWAMLRCDQAEAKARIARSVSLYGSDERFRSHTSGVGRDTMLIQAVINDELKREAGKLQQSGESAAITDQDAEHQPS